VIPVNRPLISESDLSSVLKALADGEISGEASVLKNMEIELARHLKVNDFIGVSTGTSALDLLAEVLNVSPRTVVVAPSFTIISSLSNFLRKGAQIKLVDSKPGTWQMDTLAASQIIDKETDIVIPVHIYGLSADMKPIMEATRETNTIVIEDAAEAIGVNYGDQPCGSIGDFGVFSFYANKLVTGGEGGGIAVRNSQYVEQIKSKRSLSHMKGQRFVHEELGWNYRLASMPAALINSQILRINEIVDSKIAIAEYYKSALKDHPWFTFQDAESEFSKNVYWVVGVLINDDVKLDADKLQRMLLSRDIESRRFFCPLHLQPLAKKYNLDLSQNLSFSEKLWERGLYLPSGLGTTIEEMNVVIEALWQFVKSE
jgi:perosamine synthetase